MKPYIFQLSAMIARKNCQTLLQDIIARNNCLELYLSIISYDCKEELPDIIARNNCLELYLSIISHDCKEELPYIIARNNCLELYLSIIPGKINSRQKIPGRAKLIHGKPKFWIFPDENIQNGIIQAFKRFLILE